VNATTTFEFTDILGNPFAAKVPIQNEIFPSVWYFSDNSVASVGENVVVFLDKNRDVKWEKEFNGITSSAVLQDKYIAIASAGTGNAAGGSASVTEIFGTNGRKAAQYPLPEGVISLNAYSDMLSINTGREVYFINSRGRFAGKYVSKADITGVYFFNKLEAAVVTKTNVAIFHIGG
jgi:hypothetical protein